MINLYNVLHAKILIVDDKEANVVLLDRMLRGAGYVSLSSTTDPGLVCDLHRKNRYDLILLDLQMPRLDGFLVMERLKAIESEGYLPVLVITAQPEEKVRALNAGARDFISKPFDLAEVLIRVHNMLEVRLLHLETKRLYDQVFEEQKVSEQLLLNVLPQPIVERLKGRLKVTSKGFTEHIADSYAEATVLFADIVDFTKFSEGISAEVLVDVLNDVFTRFDSIADKRGLEKIKTIGDTYMAAAGLPLPVADSTDRAAHMALDIMEAMEQFNQQSPYKLKVRIGIDTGGVVAGVIGRRKFFYDLWGDVVNTASRMESLGVPGRIQLTDTARRRLNDAFEIEERGLIDVKGKGSIHTWFLNSRTGRNARTSPVAGDGRSARIGVGL